MTEYEKWLNEKGLDEELKAELLAIADDKAAIEDAFYKDLAFGTGGLRGVIGAGTNRMNRYTVGRATFGLAEYLTETYKGEDISVVIAYDSRYKSAFFAKVAAEILSSYGITAYLFSELTPTPVLSYAVRTLKTKAGIVVTASHNPKEYNGYKVYNDKGCQITDVAADKITAKISSFGYFTPYTPDNRLIRILNDDIKNSFLNEIKRFSLTKIKEQYMPSVVYTPLHGTGMKYVEAILSDMGVKDFYAVKEQREPDPEFTTCPYPNPEERAALELALKSAKERNADLVLATDPDADRVGVAVRLKDGTYKLLNGNETGCILLYYILCAKKEKGVLGKNPTIIKTIVSTDLPFDMAKAFGAEVKEVLTGFKYIGEAIDRLDNYVFGFEESYGYLVGDHARDKDSVSAVMSIVEACAFYKEKGLSLADVMEEIYAKFGYYKTSLFSISMPGKDGMERMKQTIKEIRKNPELSFGGEKFRFTDFAEGVDGLPKSDVLRFLSDHYRLIIRPSGTEPKLKVYCQVKGKDEKEAEEMLAEITAFAKKTIV